MALFSPLTTLWAGMMMPVARIRDGLSPSHLTVHCVCEPALSLTELYGILCLPPSQGYDG